MVVAVGQDDIGGWIQCWDVGAVAGRLQLGSSATCAVPGAERLSWIWRGPLDFIAHVVRVNGGL